jgi:hypothetical protein
MEKYQMLNLIVRFGNPSAKFLATAIGLIIASLNPYEWRFILIALFTAVISYIFLKAFTELVILIVDMLIPK